MNYIKVSLIGTFILCFQVLTTAQSHLSTPMEIMSFMEASPTKYEITQLYGEAPKRQRPVLANGTFIKAKEDRK